MGDNPLTAIVNAAKGSGDIAITPVTATALAGGLNISEAKTNLLAVKIQ